MASLHLTSCGLARRFICILYYTALKHSSFGPLLDISLLIGYEGFGLTSLGDEPLLGDGYARVFLLHMYMLLAGHTNVVRY